MVAALLRMQLSKMTNIKGYNEYLLKSGDNSFGTFDNDLTKISILNEVNSNSRLTILKLNNVRDIEIELKDNSYLLLSLLLDEEINDLKIRVTAKSGTTLEGFIADFSKNNLNFDCFVDLKEENASAYIKLASLSSNKDNKEISISINHLVGKTYGRVDNYGVCKDLGKLLFAGTSHIFEKAIKSKTQQNAKIMVFDEASDAIAKPILKIDENDIEASHAAVVGKINDEHLFYLTSRGISEADAKQLITFGYLKPILAGFNNEDTRNYISSLIERRM